MKCWCEFRAPFAGAAGVAGGEKAAADQPIDVFFSLDDDHRRHDAVLAQLERGRGQQVKPVGDQPDPFHRQFAGGGVALPAALPVRRALRERFRAGPADYLEKQRSIFAAVGIGLFDMHGAVALSRRQCRGRIGPVLVRAQRDHAVRCRTLNRQRNPHGRPELYLDAFYRKSTLLSLPSPRQGGEGGGRRYIGGLTPSFSTVMRPVTRLPSGVSSATVRIAAPGFRRLGSPGT